MNNGELLVNNNYSDFTEKNYARLLRLAKKHYSFEFFGTKKTSPHILLRHDVDFSINRSLKLAEIENKLGIKSTYFIRIHSEFYNLFEKSIFEHVKNIISLKHAIGLHFEYPFYDNLTKKELVILNIIDFFQKNLEKKIKITRKMILSKIPNEILERKSKS